MIRLLLAEIRSTPFLNHVELLKEITTMKTFKLFSMAALVLLMAACSEFQQPAEGPMHFTSTIAAPNSDVLTRTTVTPGTGDDAGKYFVTWNTTDQIALIYEDTNGDRQLDVATVTDVDGLGNATISATLSGPVDGSTAVTLVYPYDIVDSANDDFLTGKNYTPVPIRYFGQNVTSIEDALPTLDWREGSAYFAVGKSGIGLNSSVIMNPQVAIWKLNLTVGGNPFTAESLEGPGGWASVTGSSVFFFVPLPYYNFEQSQGPIEFSATADYETYYVYLPTGPVTLTGGKIYTSTLALQVLLKSELSVDGSTAYHIYHNDGESWKDAIEIHKINQGDWAISDGKVQLLGNFGKYLMNADGSDYIDPTTAINPAGTYTSGY